MKRKTVLITGSSKGLGRSLAIRFAREDYNILLHGQDEKRLLKVQEDIIASSLPEFKGYCHVVIGDITAAKTIDSLYEAAARWDVDVLINNAGIYASNLFINMTSTEIKNVMDTNLVAPIKLTKIIYPIFVEKKSGLIINISSVAGKNPNEMEAIYCASKYGLRGFMDSFQIEANKNGVKIINVYLGAMQTAMTRDRIDYRRFIKPEEVADLILKISKDYKSLRITEIDLRRRMY